MSPTLAQALLTLALLVIFGGFLIWGIKSGQFRGIEEPKYRMLDDDPESGADEKGTEPEEESK